MPNHSVRPPRGPSGGSDVARGHSSVRRDAVRLAIKSHDDNSGQLTPERLVKAADVIAKFIHDGTLPE